MQYLACLEINDRAGSGLFRVKENKFTIQRKCAAVARLKAPEFFPRFNIPQPHRMITPAACQDKVTIWGKHSSIDVLHIARKLANFRACPCIPQPHRAVAAACEDVLSIRRK